MHGTADIQSAARPLAIARWLLAVAVMIALIVVIGGITRLTESGVSITEWKPVTGMIPPLTQALLPPTPTPLPLQKWGVEPYVIHFTWTRGGLDSKRWRIREARLWHDPPEYYSSPNILSVRLNVPKVRVRAGVGGCVRVGWGA